MDERILAVARREAESSTFFPYRLGAVVLDRGRVVSRGRNSRKTHTKINKYGYYCLHAECDAILRASSGNVLVVVRILRNGQFAEAKPCSKCLEFARDYGITKIIHTTQLGDLQEIEL